MLCCTTAELQHSQAASAAGLHMCMWLSTAADTWAPPMASQLLPTPKPEVHAPGYQL